MNLRPPGYEPGELPDCSTPRRRHKDSITSMPWWTWLALGIFALALVATAIFAVYAIGKVRRAEAVAERLQARLDELAHTAEVVERRMAHAQARAEELERERTRLEVSFDRLSVLTWALSDARKNVTRLREAYLRK